MSNQDNKIIWYSITNAATNTYEEFLIWQILRNICKVIQINIMSEEMFYDKENDKYFIVDFLILPVGIVVEIDGKQHLSNIEYDSKRDRFLESLGLTVLRFENKLVIEHLHEVIICILKAIGNKIEKPVSRIFYDWIGHTKKLHWDVIKTHKEELLKIKNQNFNRNKILEHKKIYSKKDLRKLSDYFLKQMFLNIK